MTQFARYEFLMNPGEVLLTAPGVYDTHEVLEGRRAALLSATGLGQDEVVCTPLLAIPIPLCSDLGPEPAAGAYDTRRAFPHVSAEALRNPLFWLPPSLYERQVRPEPSGEPDDLWAVDDATQVDPQVPAQFVLDQGSGLMVESDAAWALRVAITLTEAGLYHPTTDQGDYVAATWLDVLALVGMDPADGADAERISAWQAGAFDPDLDSIDLSPYVDLGPEGWALDHVRGIWQLVWRAAWGRLAGALDDQWTWLTLLGDLVAGGGDRVADPESAHALSILAAETVGAMVDELPDDATLTTLIAAMTRVLAGHQLDQHEAELMVEHLTSAWGESLPLTLAVLASTETSRILRHAEEAFGDGAFTIEAEFQEALTDPGDEPDPAVALMLEQMRRVRSGASVDRVATLSQVLSADADSTTLYGCIGQILCGPFSDARALITAAGLAYQPAVAFYDERLVELAA